MGYSGAELERGGLHKGGSAMEPSGACQGGGRSSLTLTERFACQQQCLGDNSDRPRAIHVSVLGIQDLLSCYLYIDLILIAFRVVLIEHGV